LLFPDQAPLFAANDIREAVACASLLCGSFKSIDAFLGFAKTEAFEIFSAHKSALAAIAEVPIEHRR